MGNKRTRSQCNASSARIECKLRPRVDSYKRCFAAQIGQIFSEVPVSVVEIGLQRGWRAAMKPGQRSLAPNTQDTELKPGEYVVDNVVGVEVPDVGRRYKVRWL
jgi:hypothetical protein